MHRLIQYVVFSLVSCLLLVCQVGTACAVEAPTNYAFWYSTAEKAAKEAWAFDGRQTGGGCGADKCRICCC